MDRISYKMLKMICFLLLSFVIQLNADECNPSITTASGSKAPQNICAGQLIFDENFDELDKKIWTPEVTLSGNGNDEFQWYVSDDENSFAKDGNLIIKPTLTAIKFGNKAIENNHIRLDDCTDSNPKYCECQAGGDVIINPVRSARLRTVKSFSFKYGRVEIIAKLPQGDWLWPAIWLLPTEWKYGDWPQSGEIDVVESRGNLKYGVDDTQQIGGEQISSTLHFGPNKKQDAYPTSTFTRNNATGFQNDFHKYEFIWDESGIKFVHDDIEMGNVPVGNGFWERGAFEGENFWATGEKMAPFDQEFHFIINLAVGGNFFPDLPNSERPWSDNTATAMKEFWTNRGKWLPTWKNRGKSSLVVDSVKVWAI